MPLTEEQKKIFAPKSQEKLTLEQAIISKKAQIELDKRQTTFSRFFQGAKERLGERVGDIKETFEEGAEGEITPVETGLRTVGAVAGGIGDIIGQAVEPVLKPTIEKLAKTDLGAKAFSTLNQSLEKYETWKNQSKENERFGEILESIVNITDIMGSAVVGKAVVKTSIKTTGKIAKKTISTAKPVTEKISAGAGRVSGEIIGATTGAGEESFVELFNNPNVIKYAREAGKKGQPALIKESLQGAEKGFRSIEKGMKNQYVKDLEKIKNVNTEFDVILDGTRENIKNLSEEFDIKFIPGKEGKKLNTVDLSNSVITQGKETVEKALNDVLSWTDTTPIGLDKLKRRLGSYVSELKSPDKATAKKVVNDLRIQVRKGLEENVEGYAEMTTKYHKTSDLLEEIESSLSVSGDITRQETTARKLIQTLRRDQDLRKDFIQKLEIASGEDISAKLAGSMLGNVLPVGLGRQLATPGVLFAVFNPAYITSLLPIAPLFSPRVMAEIVNLLGKVNRTMITKNKFSKTLEPDLKRLLNTIIETSGAIAGVSTVQGFENVLEE